MAIYPDMLRRWRERHQGLVLSRPNVKDTPPRKREVIERDKKLLFERGETESQDLTGENYLR